MDGLELIDCGIILFAVYRAAMMPLPLLSQAHLSLFVRMFVLHCQAPCSVSRLESRQQKKRPLTNASPLSYMHGMCVLFLFKLASRLLLVVVVVL